MSDTSLSADATYDDQGIYVSLIVGGVLLLVFGGFMAFLNYTRILWLKRFYRPNHTIEPTPLTQAVGVSTLAAAAARRITREEIELEAAGPPVTSPLTETEFAEHTVHFRDQNGHAVTRRKRLGISLPFRATFFVRPTWQDWISIEEPSLRDRKESALSAVHHQLPTPPPRHTSDRSFVPLRAAPLTSYRRRSGTGTGNNDSGTSNNGSGNGLRTAGRRQSYGTAQEPNTQPTSPPPVSPTSMMPALPKTPVDPLVAIYIFTLKFFFSLMLLGEVFLVWIMVIANKDDYMERTLRQRDIHKCSSQFNNKTACELLKPYCVYQGDDLGCEVVALHGLYDLTVLNIKPRSRRWVGVGVLNMCFCVVMVTMTLYYLRKVGQYVEAVMANQMRHALGYRVVCVRGLDTTEISTDTAFRKAFLQLSVYFPNAPPASPSPPLVTQQARNGTSVFVEVDDSEDRYVVCECPGLNCLFSTAGVNYYVVRRSDATFTQPGNLEQILIAREPPIGMLDIIAEAESAMAALQDAIADEKAMRRRLMLRYETRFPPPLQRRRCSSSSGHTFSRRSPATSPRRQQQRRAMSVVFDGPTGAGDAAVTVPAHDDGSRTHGLAEDGSDAVLMMRAPFPNICEKIPAVRYREVVFYQRIHEMNRALEQVPQQRVAGAAFVVFKDALSAHEFTQLFAARFGGLFSSLTATIAGPPGRIFQSSLTAGRCSLWARFLVIFVVYVVLLLTWSIPVSVLGSLEQLSELSDNALLRRYAALPPSIRSLINSYLPVATLALLNIALPHIIRFLVRAMGAFNRADCDGGQLYMQYVFMVVTAVVFQAAFQGAMGGLTDLLASPDQDTIINFFVSCISPSNGYFYAKVITATCLSTWVDLLDPVGILKALLLRGQAHIQRNYDALFLPCEFEFPRLLSFDLMVLSMGLVFHMTAPLLGLLVVGYFLVRYWSQRAKQCDRYRPTLSPAHDCTDFGVFAQVIRCVMWLYCFSETCGVLLMSLRENSGGVVLCSMTLATAVVLTIFVYIETRRWTASLANARHFARDAHHLQSRQRHRSHSPTHNDITAAQQQQQQQLAASAPTVTTPLQRNPAPSSASLPVPLLPPTSPLAPATPITPHTEAHGSASAASASQTYTNSDTLFENEAGGEDANAPSDHPRSGHSRQSAAQEEAALDNYEHVTLNQFLFDTARNPFLSHLLPRKPGVTMRYQPKHQRLCPVDAAAEVRVMKETDFVVERYWDRGMTWFEADADAYRDPTDDDDGGDGGGGGDAAGGDNAGSRRRSAHDSGAAEQTGRRARGDGGDDHGGCCNDSTNNNNGKSPAKRATAGEGVTATATVTGEAAEQHAAAAVTASGKRRPRPTPLPLVQLDDLEVVVPTQTKALPVSPRATTVMMSIAVPPSATPLDEHANGTTRSCGDGAASQSPVRMLPLRGHEEQREDSEMDHSLIRLSMTGSRVASQVGPSPGT